MELGIYRAVCSSSMTERLWDRMTCTYLQQELEHMERDRRECSQNHHRWGGDGTPGAI